MKVKRILCVLLVLCMLLPLFPAESIFAEDDYSHGKWEYSVILHTSSTKNAEANVGSKNNPTKAIKATLEFSDNGNERSASGLLTNTKKKNVDETFADNGGWLKCDYAPWSFTNLHLENLYTDYYRFYSAELKFRYIQDDKYPNSKYFGKKEFTMFKKYPGGANSKSSGGQEIVKGKDFDFDYRSNQYGNTRTVSSTVNFVKQMTKEIHLTTNDCTNNTVQYVTWDGLIQDQYSTKVSSGTFYDATCETNAPTLEFGSVTGQTGTGGSISPSSLSSYSIKTTSDGYSYNPKTLFEKMCEYRLGRFTCTLNLKLDGNIVETANVTFVRDTFEFSEIQFNNVNYTYTQGNNSINYYTDKSSSVDIKFKLSWESANAIGNYNLESLSGKKLEYQEAYIESKDSNGNAVKKYANGSKAAGSATLSGRFFTLNFPYSVNDDTGENGLKLVINGAKIVSNKVEYKFYDKNKKTSSFTDDYLTYRIDAKAPKLTFKRNDSATGYSKSAEINIASDEDSFLLSSGASNRAESAGYATLRLTDASGTVSQSIRGYNVDPSNENAAGRTSQTIPLTAGKDGTDVKISLTDKIEGEFTLVVEGEDKAKNAFKQTYSGIKLDNKAPETELISAEEGKKTDDFGNINETISNKYTVRLSDASGTGTIWYMFTETDPNTAKKLGTNETTGEDGGSASSGELQTLLGKWSSIRQSDLSSGGNAELVITMTEGKSFNGSLIWYAIDDLGNKSDYTVINNIKITNESAEYEILPSEVLIYKPSYTIEVISPNNTISYRWKKPATGKGSDSDYLFQEYRATKNGVINTASDPETASLDGEYILELKIQTPSGSVTLYPQKSFVFDGNGPDIRVTTPSSAAYSTTASVAINIDDRAGVSSAKGIVVTPSGESIEGQTEFTIPAVNGTVEGYTPNLSDLTSGAYALKITATDSNNQTETLLSDPFYIRNNAPNGSVSVSSSYLHDGSPIIANGKELALSFDITESFRNAAAAPEQTLYYRVDTSDASNGEWREAGTLTASGDTLSFKGSSKINDLDFIDGKNTLYVQIMIYPKGSKIAKLNTVSIFDTETEFYMDEKAPEQPNVIINDIHTTGSVIGYIEVSDNSFDFDGVLTAECDEEFKDNVTIGDYSGGAFGITVTKNVENAKVHIYDEAHNRVTAVFSVYGIDNEAPEIVFTEEPHTVIVGDESLGRKDAEATITVSGMTGEARFALIKSEDYSKAYKDGVIQDEYFYTDHYENDGVLFNVTKLRSEDSYFDGETNSTYRLTVSGATGTWFIGVHSEDAVGNSCDVVFDDADKKLSTKNAEASILDSDGNESWYVTPHNTEKTAVVTVSFNIPVYVLPQNMITETGDADNLELALQYAQSYSQKTSFAITDFGTYRLYTADDLGRTKYFDIKVSENASDESKFVEFNASSDVKFGIYRKEHDPNDWNLYTFEPISDGEMICAANYEEQYVLIVEPIDNSSQSDDDSSQSDDNSSQNTKETLLLPSNAPNGSDEHGFSFSYYQSIEYAVDQNGNSTDEYDLVYGYKKLVYDIYPVYLTETYFSGNMQYSDITERILDLHTFVLGSISYDTVRDFIIGSTTAEAANLGTKYAVVSGIDNSAPIITWTADPEVLTYETGTLPGGGTYDDFEMFGDWVTHPTPGNVTFTLTAQDKESGIEKIIALIYYDENGEGQEIVVTPDETGYWCWNGAEAENAIPTEVYDEENDTFKTEYINLPVVITYFDSPDADETSDKYGVKTLKYTFTDAISLTGENGISTGMFINSLGAAADIGIGSRERGITTEDIIYKMPIEEGTDYRLLYTDKNGNEITDMSESYHNNATAVIEILERGETRGLYVSNNSRALSKELNVYLPQFEFSLKDKFGYTASVAAQLEKTDSTPGTIDYTLSESGKTNRPIEILITAEDSESGIATVTLGGTESITLTQIGEGEYFGEISKNGTYNIVMYDKAGNKSVKTFSVSNVNTEIPTASVTFSSAGHDDITVAYSPQKDYDSGDGYYTSRPVTATLSFSKTDVRITSVTSSTLTEADYSVNYGTSEITFLKSGTLEVAFSDDYGNVNTGNTISVGNIDSTPPQIAEDTVTSNGNSVDVTFKLAEGQSSVRGGTRRETDILAAYGGTVKPLAYEDENGKAQKSVFTFTENGRYTIKVYDKNEPLSSYYTLSVTDIDKTAPKITLLEWWYGDDESRKETVTPTEDALGYRVATDKYDRTSDDVTVRITTGDAETKLSGINDAYSNTHTRIYGANGLFTFNAEKKSGQITPYGVDIQVIDKTPPVIDLGDVNEIIYYENAGMNDPDFDLSAALKAYSAYDVFAGVKTDLTEQVSVSYTDANGRTLNPTSLTSKDFDSSKPYTVTYTVSDSVGNKATAYRTVRLVGKNDTIVLINDMLPNSSSKLHMSGDIARLELKNFSGTAYVKYQKGLKTMGQMKTIGEVISKNESGEYVKSGLSEGWHTFFIQTDKRDYFTIGVYTAN